jgi:hypothetical protein
MVTLKEFLTTYWSQTTLILIGVGYLIQRTLNLKAKKLEINHGLFQQKRLESVNDFFSSYAKTEQMWIHLAIYDILNNRLDAKEIDNIIFPHINELQKDVLKLQIYFDENDHKLFREILQNIKDINSTLMEVYFDFDPEQNTTLKSNAFTSTRNKKLNENEILFRKLSLILKRTFN